MVYTHSIGTQLQNMMVLFQMHDARQKKKCHVELLFRCTQKHLEYLRNDVWPEIYTYVYSKNSATGQTKGLLHLQLTLFNVYIVYIFYKLWLLLVFL